IAKANSLDALEQMIDNGILVYAVRKLHTKLYLFDNKCGIMGSANFTNGGFKSNVELSILIEEENALLSELHSYFDEIMDVVKGSPEGLITKSVIETSREQYKKL